MNYEKVKELNCFVVDAATEKVEKSMENKGFDEESFKVMCKAIDNLKDLEKLKGYKEVKEAEEVEEMPLYSKLDAKKVTTEFEKLIYDIAIKRKGIEGMMALTTILADTMEDLRVLHPKMYNNSIRNLKELL